MTRWLNLAWALMLNFAWALMWRVAANYAAITLWFWHAEHVCK